MHSQRLNDTPLFPWVISKVSGEVMCGHCSCMAGLAEVCTHVAALLFWVEISVRIRDCQTVTDKAAYWITPSVSASVIPKRIEEIDFRSPKRKLNELDKELVSPDPPSRQSSKRKAIVNKATASELEAFYEGLNSCSKKAGILRVIPKYAMEYRPRSLDTPTQTLSELYDPDAHKLNEKELDEKCRDIFAKVRISSQEAAKVELETRNQCQNRKWFQLRIGRITSSVMKEACRTRVDNPSLSLIKKICYRNKFRSIATDWGIDNEKVAKDAYFSSMKTKHNNLTIRDSGLIINPKYPYIGASPDAIVQCTCCGIRCLEIKCPFSYRDKSIHKLADDETYLHYGYNGEILLKTDHNYFYQVQTQLLATGYKSCDFFVWTLKDYSLTKIENHQAVQNEIVNKSCALFRDVILYELVTKFYTNKTSPTAGNTWCICKMDENEDDMIFCESKNCKTKWFHLKCMRIKRIPKGKWFCPNCKSDNKLKTILSK